MAEIPFIDDQYIDQTIKSAGAYNPALNKTQGAKLRELIKRLRDRVEQSNNDIVNISGTQHITGTKSFTQISAEELSFIKNGFASVLRNPLNQSQDYIYSLPKESGEIAVLSQLTKNAVGLGNVDDTSDADKPISIATSLALKGKQDELDFKPEDLVNKAVSLDNPNNTKYPTTQAVSTAINIISSSLGSFAYRNSINGNEVVTGESNAAVDINVSKMLRWKHYGNSHVIFDASNGTSPTGSAIDSVNSKIEWSQSFPTLMGWNGSHTYGVRVDSANKADFWGGRRADLTSPSQMPSSLVSIGTDGVVRQSTREQLFAFQGSPLGGETLQSVMNRGSGTSNTLFITGSNRPTGNSSGKALLLEYSVTADLGHIASYDYATETYRALSLGGVGNVLVGYNSDQGYKLAVNGNFWASGGATIKQAASGDIPTLGTFTGGIKLLNQSTGIYGLDIGVANGSGDTWFQSHRNDGATNAYNLLLNPNGGNVTVGFLSDQGYSLAINGSGFFNAGININGSGVFAKKVIANDGFKSNSSKGMAGDYEVTGPVAKIIWTIGDNWNTVETMYGLGYLYESKYKSGHQIVFREAGIVRASIDTSSGNSYFDGKVVSGTGQGFRNSSYLLNQINPIWAFESDPLYGLAYYQGGALGAIGDAIGFHFDTPNIPKFWVNSGGNAYFQGGITANEISNFRSGNGPGVTLGTLDVENAYIQARTNAVETPLKIFATDVQVQTRLTSPIIKVTGKLFIPSTSGKQWSIYVQDN